MQSFKLYSLLDISMIRLRHRTYEYVIMFMLDMGNSYKFWYENQKGIECLDEDFILNCGGLLSYLHISFLTA
jgi:hypothetical protein